MSKKTPLSEDQMREIAEQASIDPDIIKSWYKGKYLTCLLEFNICVTFSAVDS